MENILISTICRDLDISEIIFVIMKLLSQIVAHPYGEQFFITMLNFASIRLEYINQIIKFIVTVLRLVSKHTMMLGLAVHLNISQVIATCPFLFDLANF